MNIEKTQRINLLLDIYGNMLTDKQKEMMELYYCYDLSLAEISENKQISRNAVHDLLKRTVHLLEKYEEKLLFLQKKEKILQLNFLSEEEKKKIQEILGDNNGI